MLFDLSSVIAQLPSGTYTVTRAAPTTTTGGRAVPGSTSTLSIVASVQPLNGRDLKQLPEGMRTEELQKIYSSTALRTQGPGQAPDKIAIGSETWEVRRVEDWSQTGNFYMAIIAKTNR